MSDKVCRAEADYTEAEIRERLGAVIYKAYDGCDNWKNSLEAVEAADATVLIVNALIGAAYEDAARFIETHYCVNDMENHYIVHEREPHPNEPLANIVRQRSPTDAARALEEREQVAFRQGLEQGVQTVTTEARRAERLKAFEEIHDNWEFTSKTEWAFDQFLHEEISRLRALPDEEEK